MKSWLFAIRQYAMRLFSVLGIALFVSMVAGIALLLSNDRGPITTTIGTTVATSIRVDEFGGQIVIANDGPLAGVIFDVPPGAFDEETAFEVTQRPFEEADVPELFEPITPLIMVENNEVFAEIPLQITIPIEIDSEHEIAMAFYFDEITKQFEAIPTLSLSDDSIVILTSHFSSIVVSKVLHRHLIDLVLMNPEKFDTGFLVGEDDFPFDNYGSEIAQGGHCAGQAIGMSWYYSERHLKYGEDALSTRFDNDTPDFWIDDSPAYRFASVLQTLFEFESTAFEQVVDSLRLPDVDRFLSVTYAIYMTRRPQMFAIYTLNDKGELDNGHAILVYKIVYEVNRFELYLADPNFHGDAARFVTYAEETGFGTYYSGSNADDIANEKGIFYTKFAHWGQSALIDYKNIESQYQKLLDETVGGDLFSSVEFEYVFKKEDGTLEWRPLTETLNYVGFSIEDGLNANEIGIRIRSTMNQFRASLYLDEIVRSSLMNNDGGSLQFTITLEAGPNDLGFLIWQVYQESGIDGNLHAYHSYHSFQITLVDEQEPLDIEEIRSGLPGQYREIERSPGVDASYPELEINLSERHYDSYSAVLFNRTDQKLYGSGSWIAGDSMLGFDPGTPVLLIDSWQFDNFYIIDPISKTLTYAFPTGETIVYQKQEAVEHFYLFYHAIALVNTSGSLYENIYESMPNPLFYDRAWKIAMNNPDGSNGQAELNIESNDPYFRIIVDDSRTEILGHRFSVNGAMTYYVPLQDGVDFVLTIEIMTWQNGDWVLAETLVLPVTVDFTP